MVVLGNTSEGTLRTVGGQYVNFNSYTTHIIMLTLRDILGPMNEKYLTAPDSSFLDSLLLYFPHRCMLLVHETDRYVIKTFRILDCLLIFRLPSLPYVAVEVIINRKRLEISGWC